MSGHLTLGGNFESCTALKPFTELCYLSGTLLESCYQTKGPQITLGEQKRMLTNKDGARTLKQVPDHRRGTMWWESKERRGPIELRRGHKAFFCGAWNVGDRLGRTGKGWLQFWEYVVFTVCILVPD